MGRPYRALADDALQALMAHDWPGNVRELENAIRHALVRCKTGPIRAEHLPPDFGRRDAAGSPLSARPAGEKLTVGSVRRALTEAKGNKVRAARALGVSRATLYRFLAAHDTAR
jgi:transcriptional regulator of acetoin/glycerol metabolism